MKRDYIVITRDMLELGLRGPELLAYALVYGFCKDGDSDFHGSASYVAQWCGVRREQAQLILRKLTDQGLIVRTGGEAGYPVHYALPGGGCAISEGARLSHTPCAISAPLPPHTPSSQDKINTSINIKTQPPRACEDMLQFGDKVVMTDAEHTKLVQRFGPADTARLCEILDDYLVNHPRKRYASHYRAILSWCVGRLQDEKLTAQRLKNAQEAAQRATGQQPRPQSDRPVYAGQAFWDHLKEIENRQK